MAGLATFITIPAPPENGYVSTMFPVDAEALEEMLRRDGMREGR